MSRTRKGSKPPGYEFWSRRPGSKHGKGRESKIRTHRAERREAKQQEKEGNRQRAIDLVGDPNNR